MNNKDYIYRLSDKLKANVAGNKAHAFLFLKKCSFRVPESYVIVADAFERFLSEGPPFLQTLKTELRKLPDVPYAVRSSTSIEDLAQHSFAGQFKTLLNVKGEEEILNAILEVWISAEKITHYACDAPDSGITGPPACAVILQEFIKPVLSGVSFSRNPVTQLNEVVIEAVEGTGEELVQKGTTPLRWRFRGERVNEGNTEYRHFRIIDQVAGDTRSLAKKYGKPADIEWVYDGDRLYYLQIREITGTKKTAVYSNRMAREMLPGQIKPLVWSVNIPLVNGTWIKLLERITGPLKTTPDQLAKPFYYQAYFNMIALGDVFREVGFSAESLEGMLLDTQAGMPRFKPKLKTLKHTFRIICFVRYLWSFEPFLNKEYAHLNNRFSELEREIEQDFSPETYADLFNKLFEAGRRIALLNIVVPLLMRFHDRRLRNKLLKLGIEYGKIDFTGFFPELKELSPTGEMNKIRMAVENLPGYDPQSCMTPDALAKLPGSAAILEDFRKFLQKFGHFSDVGTDFSVPKWEEDPDFVFRMIMQTSFVKAKFTDNFPGNQMILPDGKRLPEKLLKKAATFRVYREQISSLYIFGYGLFRKLFLKMAGRLREVGLLEDSTEIFYLRREEIDQILNETDHERLREYREIIARRKKEMEDCREISLPAVIFGDDPPIPLSGVLKSMKGVGVSPGQYTGKTRVITQISEFPKVKAGDVLVIPFADVSWTSVLVKAGAIVSEAGGMLSHCSIIAREMGIPALVSVDNALMTGDGVLVTVDGSNGNLTIHDHE